MARTVRKFQRQRLATVVADYGGAPPRELTQSRLRHDTFRDVAELIMAIGDYIYRRNQNPKPFVWTQGERYLGR
jgi:hypothetical protein